MKFFKKGLIRSEENLEKSDHLFKDLTALEKKWPDILNNYEELNGKVLEASKAFNEVKLSGDRGRILEVSKRLRESIWDRDRVKHDYQRKIDSIKRELERINMVPIRDFLDRCLEELNHLSGIQPSRKILSYTWGKNQRNKLFRVEGNDEALRQGRVMIINARAKLEEMVHDRLSNVLKKIEEEESKLENFDINKSLQWDVWDYDLKDMAPDLMAAAPDVGYPMADGTILTKEGLKDEQLFRKSSRIAEEVGFQLKERKRG
jgi:hypothetical protein